MKLYIYHDGLEKEIDGIKYKDVYSCTISSNSRYKRDKIETIIENDINEFYIITSYKDDISIIFKTNIGNFKYTLKILVDDIFKNSHTDNGHVTGRFAIYNSTLHNYYNETIQYQIRLNDWKKINNFEIGCSYKDVNYTEYIYLGNYIVPKILYGDRFNKEKFHKVNIWYKILNNSLHFDVKNIIEKSNDIPVNNIKELLNTEKDHKYKITPIYSASYVCDSTKEKVLKNIEQYEEFLKQINMLKKL